MLHIIGGLALATIIVGGAVAAIRAVTAGAIARMPAPARARTAKAGRTAARRVVEPVRHIKARAKAEARATNWLERKRAARDRRAGQPSRTQTAARIAGRGAVATGKGVARAGRAARSISLPRVAVHVPGVTDIKPATQAQPAPSLSLVPQPVTTPAAVPTPPERHPAMPQSQRTSISPHHAALNTYVASFEPEDDGDLIRFMTGEASGMAMYAQAMEQMFEHLLSGVGLDPASVQGVHELAQAVTEAASIMTRASGKFQQTYQAVRETVASGTVMPHRGRWITGESA